MNQIEIVENIMLVCLIILAIATVQTSKLRRSVIYLGGFSLLSSFIYLLKGAPDVAISEAFIGCTISVVLFLTALKKFKIMNIYYTSQDTTHQTDTYFQSFVQDLEKYLVLKDFEPQKIHTSLDDKELQEEADFDLLIVNMHSSITVYCNRCNYNTPEIKGFVEGYDEKSNIHFISIVESDEYED
jgi:putative multicomponent Na+:H+ antiporter subunit B